MTQNQKFGLRSYISKACCHLEDDDKWNWVREYYNNKMILNGGNLDGICKSYVRRR